MMSMKVLSRFLIEKKQNGQVLILEEFILTTKKGVRP